MGVCNRCGKCCRFLPVARKQTLSPWMLSYYRARCDVETDEYFLVDSPCKHLVFIGDTNDEADYYCDIHDTAPSVCKDFCGKKYWNGNVYYVPEGCGMSE